MSCCTDVGDFPDMCRVGACGCAPASSHTIATCTCPSGSCFSPDVGCHSIFSTGGAGGGSGTGGAGGGIGGAGGGSGSDGGKPDIAVSPDAQELAALCTQTGGQLDTMQCCSSVGDFINTCIVGGCSCAPSLSHAIVICACPYGCFMPEYGCLGPSRVCTAGADQTCNDDLSISSIRGKCVAPEGRCACGPGGSLSPTSGKCL
jgi:hypothetical protein